MNRKSVTFFVWILLITIVIAAVLNRDRRPPEEVVTANEALQLIDSGAVTSYTFHGPMLALATPEGDKLVSSKPEEHVNVMNRISQRGGIPYSASSAKSDGWGTSETLITLLIVVAVLVALLYFFRKIQGRSINSIVELRKTKARQIKPEDTALFTDVGGNQQAVELLGDLVDFLRSPERWTSAGLRVPRGILVVGPPGTGKTLLARAVAGETRAAFLYTSASEFVEMFVGVGAARIRDTFEKAAAQQPAVVFIDELDAIGRRRGSGTGMMHEEREQALNQLLVLMDGMERHSRLVIIAATNRPDVLDPALMRSGRFDRVLRLEMPGAAERLEILKIHARNKPLDAGVSLPELAKKTEGFSGADLEALSNAAGLAAVPCTRMGANGEVPKVSLIAADFERAYQDMIKTSRRFDCLDSVLVESASQFAEPVGRAQARVSLVGGEVVEGDVLWMNATHVKMRLADGSEVMIAKKTATQIAPLKGTQAAEPGDFTPDPWAGKTPSTG